MMTKRRLNMVRGLALIAALAAPVAMSLAQPGTLDPAIVTSNTLDASATQAIEAHASTWAPQLASTDPAAASLARERLTRPLTTASASVAFRRAYSQALTPALRGIAGGDDVGAKLGALRVAGLLATDEASEILLDALKSDDESVRLFAASQLGESLRATSAGTPAVTPEGVDEIVRALGQQIASAKNPLEAAAAVRALALATRIEHQGYGVVRNLASAQLGARTGERIRRMSSSSADELELIVALEACTAGLNAVTAPTSRPDAEGTKQIIGMGGDLLAWALARFIDGHMPPTGERGLEAQAVGAAENVIHFARQHAARLRNETPASNPSRIAQALRDGDDRSFRTAALELLGREGVLVREFGFSKDRFVDRKP
ncbi:MAG: hypothetical protein R3B57_01935 [Phycisphaerales bacterium]